MHKLDEMPITINENVDKLDDVTHERIEDQELQPLITHAQGNVETITY